MGELDSNFKISKPTLKPPSEMGKKIDTQFKTKMRNVGVNMNTIKEDDEKKKEPSLKKKIFSLPKMETLVMTDEYLSNIFNKLKKDAQETYGYHWNETIMNIMFNEYVLNDNAYLQKYKNTKTYNKKRRGEEGVEELEKNLQDKIDTKSDDETPEFDRDEKMSDIETNKDELDNFKQELKKEKMKDSENEVAEQMKKVLAEDEAMNELFGFGKPPVPLTTHKASKNDTYLVRKKDNSAVGVISPNLSPQVNQDTATKFADPNQYTRMPWYMAVKNGVKGVPPEVQDAVPGEFDALQQKYAGVPALGETKGVKMTAGDGFELQFGTTTPAEAEKAANVDSTYQNDLIYQNETTTSASSGAYVGPFPGKRKPVLDKPLWHGGVILKENKDYITNPANFKKYVLMVESVDKLQEMINTEGAGISMEQHAKNILAQLDRMKAENPDLSKLPEFGGLVKHYSELMQGGQPQQQSAVVQQPQVSEHHLNSREDKIAFIAQNGGRDQASLASLGDDEIDSIYRETESGMGINESNYKEAMKTDLKDNGKSVSKDATEKELESKEGLFKGRWNENLNEKAESKSQQRFMGMVHAAQKGELENPSSAVAKAADSMSDKDAKDFASTKHKGLPNHVKEDEIPAQGGEDIYAKIGSLVLPDSGKRPEEVAEFAKGFLRDFMNNMNPEQAYKILSDNLKELNLAEAMNGNTEPDKFQYFADTFANGQFGQLRQLLSDIRKSGELKELRVYLDELGLEDAKNWAFDNLAESMIDDQPDSMARTMDSPELNTSGTGGGSSSSSASVSENDLDVETPAQGDRQDPQAAADAAKFREFLKSKYGVESVADLAPAQKRQIMKDLAAAKAGSEPVAPEEKPDMDFKNFAATDAQRAEFQGKDNKQLSFVAANDANINTLQDYVALEKQYAEQNGEKMFHPMAILASIQTMAPDQRAKFSNVERVLTSRMKGGIEESKKTTKNKGMNEERLTPSQLNLQNIKKETAKLTQKDMADADALKQAKVYPNPDEFYIEQDEDKIQDFKTAEDLEKEALKKMEEKQALQNAGNSTNNSGKEITKRNLSKEEMLRLAMDRGDGMHNIVYDNKPSEKFEKRLEKDMGEDQYKLRQEKMEYREDAPMYNKDTQPTDKGEDTLQDNKYKVGYNEAFTGKYTDDYGKSRLVEFIIGSVEEVPLVEEGFKLNLEGLGNKYTVKINENEIFADVVNKFDYYLVENKVVKVKVGAKKEAAKDAASAILEDSMNRMSKLINYKAGDFVNSKKSLKF